MILATPRTALLFGLLATLTACQSTTRLGDVLIPAHAKSYQKTGESTFIDIQFAPASNITLIDCEALRERDEALRFVDPAITSFVVAQGAKFVAQELENEAKKYTAQYGDSVRHIFWPGKHRITFFRLLDLPQGTAQKEWTISDSPEPGVTYSKNGKKVASAYTFELEIHPATTKLPSSYAATFDLKEIWFSEAKAKIVSFNSNPLQFASAIVLETGDEVKVAISATIKTFNTKDGTKAVMNETLPKNGQTIKLDDQPSVSVKKDLGGWISLGALPTVSPADSGNKKDTQYFMGAPVIIELQVTESDPSNVQKILEDASTNVKSEDFQSGLLNGF